MLSRLRSLECLFDFCVIIAITFNCANQLLYFLRCPFVSGCPSVYISEFALLCFLYNFCASLAVLEILIRGFFSGLSSFGCLMDLLLVAGMLFSSSNLLLFLFTGLKLSWWLFFCFWILSSSQVHVKRAGFYNFLHSERFEILMWNHLVLLPPLELPNMAACSYRWPSTFLFVRIYNQVITQVIDFPK